MPDVQWSCRVNTNKLNYENASLALLSVAGKNPPKNLSARCMAFMDSYNFDVNRVRRCVVHYVTPDLKIIPFCAYNNIHRIKTEKRIRPERAELLCPNPCPKCWFIGYIQNQEDHHRTMSFQDEFRKLLERYRIAHDERYVWD
jgi:hypothetical protein